MIVPFGTQATRAAKNATETIPIVFARVGDPVGSGLVQSLARPGGNLTGVSVLSVELGAKRLELLREALPGVTRVGVLWDPSFSPAESELRQLGRRSSIDWRSTSTRGCAASRGVRGRPLGDEKAARGRGLCHWRSCFLGTSGTACRPRGQDPTTDDGMAAGVRRGWRPAVVRTELSRHLPAGGGSTWTRS